MKQRPRGRSPCSTRKTCLGRSRVSPHSYPESPRVSRTPPILKLKASRKLHEPPAIYRRIQELSSQPGDGAEPTRLPLHSPLLAKGGPLLGNTLAKAGDPNLRKAPLPCFRLNLRLRCLQRPKDPVDDVLLAREKRIGPAGMQVAERWLIQRLGVHHTARR